MTIDLERLAASDGSICQACETRAVVPVAVERGELRARAAEALSAYASESAECRAISTEGSAHILTHAGRMADAVLAAITPIVPPAGVEALLARAFDQGWCVELSRQEDGVVFASLVPWGEILPIADGEGARVSDALRDVLEAAEGEG